MSTRNLAVCSWSLRPHDPAELVERLRATGMNRVQLALAPMVAQPEVWQGVIDVLRSNAIVIESGMLAMASEDYSSIARIRETGGVRSDAHWPTNRARAAQVADIAKQFCISLVTFHAGFLPAHVGDPARATMITRLREVIDLFANVGVRVAFETGQESADTLNGVLDELDRAHVGVNFDPANMLLYGLDNPIDAFEKLLPRVRQVHAKDAIASGKTDVWGRETAVGAGQVPWQKFMWMVSTLPSEVAVVIEREGGERRVEEIVAAKNFLQPML